MLEHHFKFDLEEKKVFLQEQYNTVIGQPVGTSKADIKKCCNEYLSFLFADADKLTEDELVTYCQYTLKDATINKQDIRPILNTFKREHGVEEEEAPAGEADATAAPVKKARGRPEKTAADFRAVVKNLRNKVNRLEADLAREEVNENAEHKSASQRLLDIIQEINVLPRTC